jgi:hypothetical protein
MSPTESDPALQPGGPRAAGATLDGRPLDGTCRALVTDHYLWAVVLVWAICWLGWAIALKQYGHSLPFQDDYTFVHFGIATKEKPLTWSFLWDAANEHRAPLTRWWSVMLGRAFNWNFQRMQQVNLALLALGCLTLVLAARSVRGRSSPHDAFLPLVALSSVHTETLLLYVYAYAMALALWCIMASAVTVKWQRRSLFHLLTYVAGAVAVGWAGGPAGNLWALGLCGPLVFGCFEKTGRRWRVCALAGGGVIAASSAFLLYCTPPSSPELLAFRSDSWATTCQAAAKFSVGWIGISVLQVIWPWALIALIAPLLYLSGRFLVEVRRHRAAVLPRWLDLAALLLAALLVTGVMGYGRGRYPGIWAPRYCVLELPIAVILFLMLTRCPAPKALLSSMTIGMAICVGWHWPTAIGLGQSLRPQRLQLRDSLRAGQEPLSVLAEQYGACTGWGPQCGSHLLIRWWQHMRRASVSVFAHPPGLAERCLFWRADSGSLGAALRPVADGMAVEEVAVLAEADGPAATAVYEVLVPAAGDYQLCCRWQAPPNRFFTVAVDDGPVMQQPVSGGPSYVPCILGPMLPLEAGKHRLTITWPGAGSRLDVLELNLQRQGQRQPGTGTSDVLLTLCPPGTAAGIEGNAQVQLAPGPDGLVVRASGDDPCLFLPAFAHDAGNTLLVRVDLTSPADTVLDLFYETRKASGYSAERVVSQPLHKGRNMVYLKLTDPSLSGRLRLDPGAVPGEYVLHGIEVRAVPRESNK